MNFKRVVAIVIFIAGGVMFGVSLYIKEQVRQGKIEVSDAKRNVERGRSLFSLTPATEPIGEGLARAAEGKIRSGEEQIAYYSHMAQMLQIGGIVLMVAGAGLFFVVRRSRK
jgi:hypothetical protein